MLTRAARIVRNALTARHATTATHEHPKAQHLRHTLTQGASTALDPLDLALQRGHA